MAGDGLAVDVPGVMPVPELAAVEAAVIASFAVVAGGAGPLSVGTPIALLELRRLDFVQIACALEHEFGVVLEPDDVRGAATIAALAEQVWRVLATEAGGVHANTGI